MGISDLSDDVLIYILVRLPLESLGQFKCISKSWNALISSHKFIDSHLNQSRIVQNPNVLLHNYEVEIQMAEFSITGEIMDVHQNFDCNLKQIYRLPESLDERRIMQIVGSANGLLCLLLSPIHFHSSSDCDFALCNPLTKSTWELPGNQWRELFDYDSLFGFWYDDIDDDYKVVMMNHVLEKVGIHAYECQVYSLRSNSWSKVHSYLDFSFDYTFSDYDYGIGFRITCAGVLANCALHWILSDYNSRPIFILAFDLRTYKPNLLPLPEDIGRLGGNDHLKLTVLNSSLVLVLNFRSVYDELCDSWIMKDYGLNDSWMKINIDTSFVGDALTPLALFDNNHKRILLCFDNSYNVDYEAFLLHLIDLVSHQNQFIPAPCHFKLAKQLQFVGSLVQPYPPFIGHENVYSEEDMLGSPDLVADGESLIKEQILNVPKNFDKFHIHVNGVSIDSQLPEHVRRKYYDLCCRKKLFIHEQLVPEMPCKLAVSMIIEVVNIADSIRSCRFTTTSKEEIEQWEKSLRSFELLGMNVGFLCDRIRRLLCLAFDSEEGIEAKKFWEVKTERSEIKDDIEDLEKRLEEMKEMYKKYGDEANERKPKAKSYELMFQEEANAPW